ncbi:MAG: HD domain-containing protein [Thermovirgaceae bacterium]|nr:HD domain-containing protein [Thermovirgaceae bacterium]
MNGKELQEIIQWFLDYPERFRGRDGRIHRMLELKRDHSRRVAGYCRFIAFEIGWKPGPVNTAEAIGWLHDVGRFSQWDEFGTFYDPASIDHGAKGREVIENEGVLEFLPEATRTAILDSVILHNHREIPESTDPLSLPFARLIRDADKLDIFNLVYGHLAAGTIRKLLPGISTEKTASAPLMEEISRDGRASCHNVKTVPDFLLTQVSWVSNINYAPTFRRISENRLIERLRKYLPSRNPGIDSIINSALKQVAEGCIS